MCDEMAIRRHVQFNPSRSKFDGFIDIGRTNANDENVAVAKDALVFMVSNILMEIRHHFLIYQMK